MNRIAKYVEVQNMILRNGWLLSDDGGSGEIVTHAIQLPDGGLVAGEEHEIKYLCWDTGMDRWGIACPTRTKYVAQLFAPGHDLWIHVKIADNGNNKNYRNSALLITPDQFEQKGIEA